jgi:hypothetical protein
LRARLAIVPVLVVALLAACGGGGDDDAASDEEFCRLWSSVTDEQSPLSAPAGDGLAAARDLLASARAAAPDEIGREVDDNGEALVGVLDDVEAGREPERGALVSLGLRAAPRIDAWMTEHCPTYESPLAP